MNKRSGTGGGIEFTGLLTIAFIILKLCGVINWSWIWVLSPIWIAFVLAFVIVFIALVLEEMKKGD